MSERTDTPQHEQTSGTDVRGSRPLMERLMVFALADEIERLKEEPKWRDGDRNSVMLAKEREFRVLLSVLKPGAVIEEKDGAGRLTLQVLAGAATLRLPDESAELASGELATVEADTPYSVEATTDSALLLTMAWPEAPAAGGTDT